MALINIRIEKVVVEQDPEVKAMLKRIDEALTNDERFKRTLLELIKELKDDDKLRGEIIAKLNNIISDIKSTI
jgi:hypothetical protein